MERHEPRAVALSARVYRGCLRAYPAAFRRAYGRDMARVFQDACRDAYHAAGTWGVLLLWGPILRDLVANVTGEHLAALRGGEGEIMVVEGQGRSVWLWWAVAGAVGWGLAQWLVLRQHVRHAGWWIAASAVGWLIAAFVEILISVVIARMIGPHAFGTGAWWPMWLIDAAVLGGLYGALLGRVFVALLRVSPRSLTMA